MQFVTGFQYHFPYNFPDLTAQDEAELRVSLFDDFTLLLPPLNPARVEREIYERAKYFNSFLTQVQHRRASCVTAKLCVMCTGCAAHPVRRALQAEAPASGARDVGATSSGSGRENGRGLLSSARQLPDIQLRGLESDSSMGRGQPRLRETHAGHCSAPCPSMAHASACVRCPPPHASARVRCPPPPHASARVRFTRHDVGT